MEKYKEKAKLMSRSYFQTQKVARFKLGKNGQVYLLSSYKKISRLQYISKFIANQECHSYQEVKRKANVTKA